MTRRSFFAAVGAAIAAARAPRLEAGSEGGYPVGVAGVNAAGWPIRAELGGAIAQGFFRVGDVLTFGADPREYVVTSMSVSSVELRAVMNEPGTLAWRRDELLAVEAGALSASTNDASPIRLNPGAVRRSRGVSAMRIGSFGGPRLLGCVRAGGAMRERVQYPNRL